MLKMQRIYCQELEGTFKIQQKGNQINGIKGEERNLEKMEEDQMIGKELEETVKRRIEEAKERESKINSISQNRM